jgi:hypothetical protein
MSSQTETEDTSAQSTVDDKKWATGIIATIVSGSIGFATGKAIS